VSKSKWGGGDTCDTWIGGQHHAAVLTCKGDWKGAPRRGPCCSRTSCCSTGALQAGSGDDGAALPMNCGDASVAYHAGFFLVALQGISPVLGSHLCMSTTYFAPRGGLAAICQCVFCAGNSLFLSCCKLALPCTSCNMILGDCNSCSALRSLPSAAKLPTSISQPAKQHKSSQTGASLLQSPEPSIKLTSDNNQLTRYRLKRSASPPPPGCSLGAALLRLCWVSYQQICAERNLERASALQTHGSPSRKQEGERGGLLCNLTSPEPHSNTN
jgi:hypothetical protein